MSLPQKFFTYLEKNKAKYETVKHRVVYTAYDLAETLHLPHGSIVKNLLIKTEKGLHLALLSAAHQLDIKKLLNVLKAKKLSILKEKDMIQALKLGKRPLPSFGGLYKIPVILEKALLKNKKLVLSGGSFTDSLILPVKDFLILEQPIVGVFGIAKKMPKKKVIKKKAPAKRPVKKIMKKKKK